ncbi:hypothetical protein CLV24_102243 [Pontibacter ummariensis]|uniref:Uncharacterized protein n=1 Tax=Pontibacter ummariensis TaxID=1610492 RepID=A0A239BUR2_9BACT|nr:hypothetical protein [Pontibacter ummariensis]PRY15621.1 hypothetical protein CLV24_102243 [Pontibacter ummariensis]SNS11372.1 hypothetical protein SAMN06296052_102169 [Pontibacter ummariensis]
MLMTIEETRTYTSLEDFLDSLADRNLTCYATDLLQQRGCASIEDLGRAVKRATEVCNSMHLPLRENFKVVYRSQNGEVVQDWRLSPMAYLLMVLNSDSQNDVVARMQVEMVKRVLQQ